MKKLILLSLATCLFAAAYSQKNNKGGATPATPTVAATPDKDYEHHRKVYERALGFNDLGVAAQAVYDILALGGHENYLDTLAMLYFQRSAWIQVISVSSKIIETRPKDAAPLELRAVAYQSAGFIKESLADYENLYPLTNNPYYLYEIAALQYTLRRLGECDQTLGRLMAQEKINEMKIKLSYGQGSQEVPMVAACTNMIGVLLLEQGKKEEAKRAFQDAIKMFPDFMLAKNNLAEAEKP